MLGGAVEATGSVGQSGELCRACGEPAFCGAVVRVPRTDMAMVPYTGSLTGGRALSRARLLRQLGYKPSAPPTISDEDRLIKVAHRAAVVSEKRLRRGDMVRARNLLLALEEESSAILEEVHGDEWHPHRRIHLIFPTGEVSASATDPVT